MSRDLTKTLSFLALHLLVGFTVAYVFTGSIVIAGGIALIEPCVNAVVFYFHERAWNRSEGVAPKAGAPLLRRSFSHRHGAAALEPTPRTFPDRPGADPQLV